MDFRKVVLITGASRGIGRSTAIEFASKGYDVIINYNNSENEIYELKKLIEDKYNVKVLVVKADVSNEEEVKLMIEKSISEFKNINCLVNNAGIALDTIVDDKTKDNFMRILNVNLIGTFLVSKYVLKYSKELESIINVSSTNGIDTNYPESMDYDASKAGVISLTRNLALEYSPKVRINTVAPGWVLTDMNKDMDEELITKEKEKILLNRFADPSEIAKVIYFLASPSASYINGSIIRVDGGVR